jgi:tRNA(fMet)-specific endonuclease VapC
MVERFAALTRDQVWLSAIVAAELRYGAAKLASHRFSAAVEAWLAGFEVRPWPLDATHQYAQIRTALERVGKPIGGMDLMITAPLLSLFVIPAIYLIWRRRELLSPGQVGEAALT